MRLLGAAVVGFALVFAGCGASANPHHAAPQLSQADRMKAVVRAWTGDVNADDNAAAARLFSLPAVISLMEGPYGCWCFTRAEVFDFHAQLLCTGEIVSIKVRGRAATAVFGSPGDRLNSKCDSPPGSLTAVRFTIARGKICVWQQVWWKPPGRAAIRAPGAQKPPSGWPYTKFCSA
jgi:hypothetical protein